MNKKNRLKLLFKSLFVSFGQVKTDDGVVLLWDEDTELIVGYKVYVERENENGEIEYVAPENGEYVSGNTVFTIEDGVCTKIENKEVAEPENMETEESKEEVKAEEQPAEEPAQEPAEEPAQEPEPEFNAEQAIAELRAEYEGKLADLEQRFADMRAQLDALLALPAEENAFEKESKEDNKKPLFKSQKN